MLSNDLAGVLCSPLEFFSVVGVGGSTVVFFSSSKSCLSRLTLGLLLRLRLDGLCLLALASCSRLFGVSDEGTAVAAALYAVVVVVVVVAF